MKWSFYVLTERLEDLEIKSFLYIFRHTNVLNYILFWIEHVLIKFKNYIVMKTKNSHKQFLNLGGIQ